MDERQAKRDIAFGTLGFIWGSLIVVFGIFNPGVPSASSAYDTGQFAGIVFGVLFAVAGFTTAAAATKRAGGSRRTDRPHRT
jgi:hypothetical protein